MKDHQIAELVNLITKNVAPITDNQSLRTLVSKSVIEYLDSKGLRDGWVRVVHAHECGECECCDDLLCPVCGDHYGECHCPGPSMEDEYIYNDDYTKAKKR